MVNISFRRIDSSSGERCAASTVLTSVKCICSRATQQESYGQRSACLALLTQSAHYAAQRRYRSPRISCYIFLILWQSWQVVPPPAPPSRFLFFLSSFFVFPLMEAAVLPCLHPEVRRIKLHLHFFLPCCGVVSLWSRCFESSGPVGEAGILKLRVDYLKLLGDDSGQHVLDYVPLFSWRDSNETWQRQQQCFLQQKEWWLAIHLWLGIFTCHMGSSAKRASHLHEGRKSAKNTQCTLKFIARKNALYVWGGNRMTARLKSASSVFWWNGAFAYQIVKQMQDFESEITKAKRL